MKKFFSKILIAILILGFFLAPITPKIDTQNHLSLTKNEAKAQEKKTYWVFSTTIGPLAGQIKKSESEIACNAERALYLGSNPTPCVKTIELTEAQIDTEIAKASTSFFDCAPTNLIQCLVQVIYTIIWTPISWITFLAANILDFFIWYSLKSGSYETDFVNNGWAVVRDIANLFFIIALLYVAGKTVLGLNASNNKKVITMVILMALLINFSLFISKVVIDSSNILARVFYSSIENVNEKNETNTAGAEGEKQITVGLVKTFDPQLLFINSGVNNIDNNTATFVILMFISGALMIYMIITFLSIAFLFVGRVVGLWILMIFAPIAFASYTMPSFRIPKFGNQEWWSTLFSLSFSAPIFIFFLYLIISFGDAFKIVTYGENGEVFSTGIANGDVDQMKTYLSVIIPFALVYVLLKQAKETTTKMAGDIAQGVNTAGKALVGATVGLAAAGTAMAGRKVIGETLARASRGETLSQRYANGDTASMSNFQKVRGLIGSTLGFNKLYGRDQGLYDTKTRKALGVTTGLGGLVNTSQRKIKEVEHGRHEIDEATKKAGVSGVPYERWSKVEKDKVLEEFGKLNKADIESDITSGKTNLYNESGVLIAGIKGKDAYFASKRQELIDNMQRAPSPGDVEIATGELTDQGRKKVENQLNIEFNKVMNKTKEKVTESKFDHAIKETKTSISNTEKVFSKGTSGSYDIRNFNPVADKKSSLMNKVALFYLASIASSLRSGLKSTDMNPGKGQGDILKDLSSTVTSALKGIKIDIKSSGGGGGGHDDHGGGGHDDHGGGHGGGHH